MNANTCAFCTAKTSVPEPQLVASASPVPKAGGIRKDCVVQSGRIHPDPGRGSNSRAWPCGVWQVTLSCASQGNAVMCVQPLSCRGVIKTRLLTSSQLFGEEGLLSQMFPGGRWLPETYSPWESHVTPCWPSASWVAKRLRSLDAEVPLPAPSVPIPWKCHELACLVIFLAFPLPLLL